MDPLLIRSLHGDYEVVFQAGLDQLREELESYAGAPVAIDARVYELYREQLGSLLERGPVHLIEATEDEKTLDGVERFIAVLQQAQASKGTTVVAVGGGIVQDIVAFATGIYHRGISWVYAPTTLLAMADSCIGAKCGINHGGHKNQLGLFSAPSRILLTPAFLDTLSDDDVASGYGEILKLALTASADQYDELVAAVETQGWRNDRLLALIRESLEAKRTVIEEDEHESDLRRILNYGHTFGHALESVTNYEVPHGKAVAWGIDLVNRIAVERDHLDCAEFERIHNFIAEHFAHRITSEVDPDRLVEAARRDKKASGDTVALILLREPGQLEIVPTRFDDELMRQVRDHLASDRVVRRA